MKGGAPRAVWLSLGLDPQMISALSAAQRLSRDGRAPHLVWNPVSGETVQLIPVIRAGCALVPAHEVIDVEKPLPELCGPGPLAAEPHLPVTDAHTHGRVCVQIGVVAYGWEPFTAGPLTGLSPILDWLESWGVARRWPAGQPAPFASAYTAQRSRRVWARGGHYGASQVPGCAAAGPGAIDVSLLMETANSVETEVSLPRSNGAPRTRAGAVSRMGGTRAAIAGEEPAEALARAV